MKNLILAINFANVKGNTRIRIETTDGVLWVSPKQWNAKNLSPEFGSYVGGNAVPVYFAKGEDLITGEKCTEDNKLLKDFYVSPNPEVAGAALAASAQTRFNLAMAVAAKKPTVGG